MLPRHPRTGLFLLALIPQFAPIDAAPLHVIAVVGGTVAVVFGGRLAIVAPGIRTAGTWRHRSTVTGRMHHIFGIVFIMRGLMTTVPAIIAPVITVLR